MNPTVAGVIWILLGLGLLAFALLLLLEGSLYIAHQAPITAYVRNWTWKHVFPAALVAVVLVAGSAMAITHFILDGQK